MPEKPQGGEEAKGLSESILQVIGVAELLLGAVSLYVLRVIRPGAVEALHFSSTGHEVVDVGLLVCAAGLVGKVVHLVAELLAALPGLNGKTKDAIKTHLKATQVAQAPEGFWDLDLYDRAEAHLRARSPAGAAKYARQHDSASVFCGVSLVTAIVAVLSAFSPDDDPSAFHRHWGIAVAIAVVLAGVGLLLQYGALHDLAIELSAVQTATTTPKEG